MLKQDKAVYDGSNDHGIYSEKLDFGNGNEDFLTNNLNNGSHLEHKEYKEHKEQKEYIKHVEDLERMEHKNNNLEQLPTTNITTNTIRHISNSNESIKTGNSPNEISHSNDTQNNTPSQI